MPIRPTACPRPEPQDAIWLGARLEGMITDPVYEGKSMQGMIDLVRKAIFPRDRECSTRISAAHRPLMDTAIRSARVSGPRRSRRPPA